MHRVVAIEVKNGRSRGAQSGLTAFEDSFGPEKMLLVGRDRVTVEEFLSRPVSDWTGF
jgi:hypothetical protein